jgi:hypothetical protein
MGEPYTSAVNVSGSLWPGHKAKARKGNLLRRLSRAVRRGKKKNR